MNLNMYYSNSGNICTNQLFTSGHVHGNKITVYVNVRNIKRRAEFPTYPRSTVPCFEASTAFEFCTLPFSLILHGTIKFSLLIFRNFPFVNGKDLRKHISQI